MERDLEGSVSPNVCAILPSDLQEPCRSCSLQPPTCFPCLSFCYCIWHISPILNSAWVAAQFLYALGFWASSGCISKHNWQTNFSPSFKAQLKCHTNKTFPNSPKHCHAFLFALGFFPNYIACLVHCIWIICRHNLSPPLHYGLLPEHATGALYIRNECFSDSAMHTYLL